jgi:hypothetical protein
VNSILVSHTYISKMELELIEIFFVHSEIHKHSEDILLRSQLWIQVSGIIHLVQDE